MDMNILNLINGLIGAIMAAIMGFSGTPATPEKAAQIQEVASTTTAVVKEAVQQTATTSPEATQQAYDLGVSIGRLQAQAEQITSTATTTMTPAQPPAPAPTPSPAPEPSPTAPPVASAPVSQARIVIINPLSGKGTDHALSTSADFDERGNPRNEVYVGAIVYGVDGQPVNDATVAITATDDSQNKTLTATGNLTPIYVNGQKIPTYYYPFDYMLKTAGTHTIKFSALNLDEQISFEVTQ
jgi:hypothetical protein